MTFEGLSRDWSLSIAQTSTSPPQETEAFADEILRKGKFNFREKCREQSKTEIENDAEKKGPGKRIKDKTRKFSGDIHNSYDDTHFVNQ